MAQKESQKKYETQKQVVLSVKLNREKDSALLDYIGASIPNFSGWIKKLMYEDMRQNGNK